MTTIAPPAVWTPPPEDSPERRLLGRSLRTARGRRAVLSALYHPLRGLTVWQGSIVDNLAEAILEATGPLGKLPGEWNHVRTLAGRVMLTEAVLSRLDGTEDFDCSDLLEAVVEAKVIVGEADPYPAQKSLAWWVAGVEI